MSGFERWYLWAGVPIGTTYPEAERMVSEAVSRLEAERDAMRVVLEEIRDAPPRSLTWDSVRWLAAEVLARFECGVDG